VVAPPWTALQPLAAVGRRGTRAIHTSPHQPEGICGVAGGRGQQCRSLSRRGGQQAPTFPPAPGRELILSLGRVSSGHSVGAEVLAPATAPLQPPKALACPSQPLGAKDDHATSGVLKASWVLGCSHLLEPAETNVSILLYSCQLFNHSFVAFHFFISNF